jgi:hypothetical protein
MADHARSDYRHALSILLSYVVHQRARHPDEDAYGLACAVEVIQKEQENLTRMETQREPITSRTAPANEDAPAFTLGPWEVAPHSDTDEVLNVVAGYREEIRDGRTIKVANWIAECDASIDFASDVEAELTRNAANARLIAAAPHLYVALADLVNIIDKAGLLHLSNGVQLGATSWYVKASDRMEAARRAIEGAVGSPEASS